MRSVFCRHFEQANQAGASLNWQSSSGCAEGVVGTSLLLLPASDLCPLLGIHADSIRWRFKTGKYPQVPCDGKGRLFTLADIERILAITKNLPGCRNPNQEGCP
jgi:hypothetical protein